MGPGSVVADNVVGGNGLDGISLFARTHGNRVVGNGVQGNGFMGAVPGDGIRIFGGGNHIEGNRVVGNAADGISIGRRSFAPLGSLPPPNGMGNAVRHNRSYRNGAWDLFDSNIAPPCDSNVWASNAYGTANQPCVAS